MDTTTLVAAAAAATAGGLLLVRAMRRTETTNRAAIDRWVDETLARAMAAALGRPAEALAAALAGERPDLRDGVDRHLSSVRLVFRRQPARRVEVNLEAAFSPGTALRTRYVASWDEVPSIVRTEFLRTGADEVTRAWAPPWRSP